MLKKSIYINAEVMIGELNASYLTCNHSTKAPGTCNSPARFRLTGDSTHPEHAHT